jgi:hypothetical protein
LVLEQEQGLDRAQAWVLAPVQEAEAQEEEVVLTRGAREGGRPEAGPRLEVGKRQEEAVQQLRQRLEVQAGSGRLVT